MINLIQVDESQYPFRQQPPTFIRALLYKYWFTDAQENGWVHGPVCCTFVDYWSLETRCLSCPDELQTINKLNALSSGGSPSSGGGDAM